MILAEQCRDEGMEGHLPTRGFRSLWAMGNQLPDLVTGRTSEWTL